MMGDPLSEVEVHPGGFVLAFEGGSRELWSRTYGFAYSQARDGWYLERVDMKVLDRIDGRGEDKSATGEQIGVVSKIGRASCRERVGRCASFSVGAGSCK